MDKAPLVIKPRPPFPMWLDSSAIADFKSCEMKAFWGSFQRFEPSPSSVHLHAGKSFARGIEVARRAYFVHNCDSETAIARGMAALWREYGDYETPGDSYKSWQGMTYALIFYFEYWPFAEDHVRPLLIGEEHAIEFSFAVPLEIKHPETGDPILLTGRADMFGQFKDSLYAVDEKTTKGIGPMWAEQWNLRGQFLCYTWAGRQYGYNVKGAIIRGIAILKSENKAAEAIRLYHDGLIDRWYKSTIATIQRMIRAWEKGEFNYDFSHACTAYSGCPFVKLCEAPDPAHWLMYYQERTWNPLNNPDAA